MTQSACSATSPISISLYLMLNKRRLLKRPLRLLSRLAAPVAAASARTGIGAAEWMRYGVLPVAAHYYQPIFNPDDLPDDLWNRAHELAGVDLRVESQRALLARLAPYGSEPAWPPGPDAVGYHWDNASFSYSSAVLLYSIVRHFRPAAVIEVGAGMSTLVLAEALARNGGGVLTTIEPHPREAPLFETAGARLIAKPVQDVSLRTFEGLRSGDVLFIDSSHVVKTGGDVNYLYLEVLPRLRSGVIVHIHDIYLPYEYDRTYSGRTDAPRFFWTEQYLLQALLSENPRWEVLMAGYLLQRDYASEVAAAFPGWEPSRHRPTTSFYIRRQ